MTTIETTTEPSEAERLLYGPALYLTLPQAASLLGITRRAAETEVTKKGSLWGMPVDQPGGPGGTRRVPTVAIRRLHERLLADTQAEVEQ